MFSNLQSSLYESLDQKVFKNDQKAHHISPRRTNLRWVALFFCCLTTMGGYYCHDAAPPLQTPMMQLFDIGATRFNLIYTVYSLPNIIMPLLGGFIIDKLGVRIGLALFAGLICLGQVIVVFGAYVLSFEIIIAGTGILGIGLDSLCAAKSTIVVKWFQGQELALSMGLTLTVSRLGSSLSSYLSPVLYAKSMDLVDPLNFGLLLGIFSLLAVGILCFFDDYADVREGKLTSSETKSKEEFKISDMKDFRLIFYLIMANCMLTYASIKGLLFNSSDLMNKRFGFNPQLAGKYLSVVFILATVLSPVFGGIVDRIGKRVLMILASIMIMTFVHIYVAFLRDSTPDDPNTNILWGLVGTGIAFSAYAAVIWPCVSLVVKKNANGTAYGFALAMQNLMLSIVPLLIGFIHDRTLETSYGYFWTEIFLVALSVIGIINTIWIKKEDDKTGAVLESAHIETKEDVYAKLPSYRESLELAESSTKNKYIY